MTHDTERIIDDIRDAATRICGGHSFRAEHLAELVPELIAAGVPICEVSFFQGPNGDSENDYCFCLILAFHLAVVIRSTDEAPTSDFFASVREYLTERNTLSSVVVLEFGTQNLRVFRFSLPAALSLPIEAITLKPEMKSDSLPTAALGLECSKNPTSFLRKIPSCRRSSTISDAWMIFSLACTLLVLTGRCIAWFSSN